jgi:hypothetical protein
VRVTLFILLAFIGSSSFAQDACPAPKLLAEFDSAFHECSHGMQNGSCKRFVEIFRQLIPKYDCRRSFDTSPVPAAWLASSAALEDYVRLLSTLHDAAARKLFSSAEFREILDGALAEDYMELSRKVEKEMSTQGKPPNTSLERTRER